LSNRLVPVSRKELIKRLGELGFEGPYPGGDHEYMTRSGVYVRIPNIHRSDEISVRLLSRILRDAMITREDWFSVA
jgi:predicted RNA binding protein YcfA (HicA-like mRNA interferase family)